MLFTVSSAVYLYLDIYTPLSTHYSAVVSIASDIHETLIIRTLKINALFFVLMTAGVLILGILYTHRICGPMKSVQIFAKAVSEGRLDTRISFREKDAIHPFGDTFNDMTEAHSKTVKKLAAETKELKAAVRKLEALSKEGKETGPAMENVSEIDMRIKEVLKKITV
jgi:nitrogen fixation/metabolism regulation signal transduction histidine kinase